MIYKSYLAEQNKSFITENNLVLFYGENLGLKNDFKKKIFNSVKDKVIRKNQEEILKNKGNFFEEVLNVSLFGENKIFLIDDVNDKFIDIFHEIENKIDHNKIFLFSNILDKKSKLRNYFEKSKELNAVACYQDNIITIKKIVRNELNAYDNLNNENINIIAENCNLDRDKLYNEIEKVKI
jgi:DNA polymerase-3 subunit delta